VFWLWAEKMGLYFWTGFGGPLEIWGDVLQPLQPSYTVNASLCCAHYNKHYRYEMCLTLPVKLKLHFYSRGGDSSFVPVDLIFYQHTKFDADIVIFRGSAPVCLGNEIQVGAPWWLNSTSGLDSDKCHSGPHRLYINNYRTKLVSHSLYLLPYQFLLIEAEKSKVKCLGYDGCKFLCFRSMYRRRRHYEVLL